MFKPTTSYLRRLPYCPCILRDIRCYMKATSDILRLGLLSSRKALLDGNMLDVRNRLQKEQQRAVCASYLSFGSQSLAFEYIIDLFVLTVRFSCLLGPSNCPGVRSARHLWHYSPTRSIAPVLWYSHWRRSLDSLAGLSSYELQR